MPELISIALVLVTLFFAFYLYAKFKQTYWARRGVYSPPAHWLFGNLQESILLRESPQRVLTNLYNYCKDKTDSPVFGVYIMQKPFLILRSPEVIKQVSSLFFIYLRSVKYKFQEKSALDLKYFN